jgi:hypothetical protein
LRLVVCALTHSVPAPARFSVCLRSGCFATESFASLMTRIQFGGLPKGWPRVLPRRSSAAMASCIICTYCVNC